MEQREYVENALAQLEKHLKLRLTVIDWNGLFNYKQKSEVFIATRRSHQINPSCKIGFCDTCIKNCRFRINQLCQNTPQACYSVCWKGIGQIAVPLRYMNFHYGILYAGNFRDPSVTPPDGLPANFYRAYETLPFSSKKTLDQLMGVLDLFAQGMIHYLRNENILNDEYDFRVGRIYSFIEENRHRSIGLPDIAEYLQLSESYASLFITRSTGQSFSQLLRRKRIDSAKKLLVTTEENLHGIALKCGFSSEFHLSKVFKEITGISPSEFRCVNK